MANTYSPRFGVGSNQDNTGRVITNAYSEPAYASTLAVYPNASSTIYNVGQLTGAMTINSTNTSCSVGDTVTFLFSSDSTNRIVTFGTGLSSSGTLTVTGTKYGSATFRYNGTTFVEVSRAVTA